MAKATLKIAMLIITGALLVTSFGYAPNANAAMNNLTSDERMQLVNQQQQMIDQVTQMWNQTHMMMNSMMNGNMTANEKQMMKMMENMMNMIKMLMQTNQYMVNVEKGTPMNK